MLILSREKIIENPSLSLREMKAMMIDHHKWISHVERRGMEFGKGMIDDEGI